MKRLCGGTFCLLVLSMVLAAAPARAGAITYSCSSNITNGSLVSITEGLQICNYLNQGIAPIYGGIFTNANSKIFIQFQSGNSTLGENVQAINVATYGNYFTQLSSESTDYQAVNSLAVGASSLGSEPTIFGNGNIGLTASLASALNFGGVGGVTAPTTAGTNMGIATCSISNIGCYDGVITIGSLNQMWFNQAISGGTAPPNGDYDFAAVVEHETDEVLGTLSCIATTSGEFDQCGQASTSPNSPDAAAIDLFRYSASGARVFSAQTAAYFSPDGGVTDTDGNQFNYQFANQDWADFTSNCTFVQDAVGCNNGTALDITSDGPAGTRGPEVAMLNAVGYNLTGPEPASMFLFATGLAGMIAGARRKRKTS